MIKVNIVPISMVLAQSALETGWGTSRFAVDGNNYFGEHCFKIGCGIIPKNRNPNTFNEVKKFSAPIASVKSYLLLLNTGSKFYSFRQLRKKLIDQGQNLNGKTLIRELIHYSELKNREYEKRLLNMMDTNNLYQYNKSWD